MSLKFMALPTDIVRELQNGASDANGQLPERHISTGPGNPCRHCLKDVPRGDPMLVLAYRPFPDRQPYSEVGPIFLCAAPCERHPESAELPALYQQRGTMLIRGYDTDNRMVYSTTQQTATADAEDAITQILSDDAIAYVHMRSPTSTCFHCRIERGQ